MRTQTKRQERQKQLDKILEKKIEIPESLKKIHFTFPPAPHSGKLVLRLNGITKSYDGKRNVLDNLDLTVENGERLVVAGRNGAGKSTLLRILSGEDSSFSGEIIPGAGVKIGYFSQDNAETIKGSESILDYVEARAPFDLIPKLRDMLGAFLFRGDDVYKSLDVLSGGEKSRIALLLLLLSPNNLLILDEPTNHLDMHSKDVLLDALKDFGGTVIFVSHDRGFIEGLSTRVLELTPGRARNFPGNYTYYLERLKAEEENPELRGEGFGSLSGVSSASSGAGASGGNGKNATGAGSGSGSASAGASGAGGSSGASGSSGTGGAGQSNKLSWEEQKKAEAERRKAEKEVARIEKAISDLEEEKKALGEKMALPEIYSNGEKAKEVQRKIDETEEKLLALNEEWEKAALILEDLN